jgi:hypothetical protein
MQPTRRRQTGMEIVSFVESGGTDRLAATIV